MEETRFTRKMNHGLTKAIRIKLGRNAEPSASIVDSQAANENDRDGIINALDNMTGKYSTIRKMWLDMSYQGKDLRNKTNQEY